MSSDFSFEPVEVAPAYEYVTARIRRAIQLSEILPGEKLPSERSLSESLGVSRVTVREALRVLQGQGVIDVKRGKNGGSIVLPTTRPGNHPGLAKTVREVHEVRVCTEPMAAMLAAERAGMEEIEEIRSFHEQLSGAKDIGEFRRWDSGFHRAIAAASGNGLLGQVIDDARSAMFHLLDATDFAIIHSTSVRAHERIMVAIATHDAAAAGGAMREHILEARDEIMRALGIDSGS